MYVLLDAVTTYLVYELFVDNWLSHNSLWVRNGLAVKVSDFGMLGS